MVALSLRGAMLSLHDEPLYDVAAAGELLMLVGRPDKADAEDVAHALSRLAASFAFDFCGESQASTPEREKGAKRLAAACAKVLEIAGVANGGELLPMFGQGGLFMAAAIRGEPRGEAATMNALRAVDTLRQDALKMLEIEGKRRRMNGVKAGRPEVAAKRKLVRELSCLYERVWRKTPGISTGDKAEPCGPLMRLMLDVVRRLRIRGVGVRASPDSLRAIWRSLDDEDRMPETHLLRQAGMFNEATGSLPK